MIKFVLFIKKVHVLLIFILMEALALNYYANSTSYTKAKLLTASNKVVGTIYDGVSGIGNYFSLKRENEMLVSEVAALRNTLDTYDGSGSIDNIPCGEINTYWYTTARIINNSVTRQENYFTLNKGMRDDVEAGMAVISPNGTAVGYVLSVSEKFAVCISVLNTSFRTSGRIKNGDFFGSIYWDGRSQEYIMMSEMSKYAVIEKGDTILTTEYSSIFPPDMMLGTVENFRLTGDQSYYEVKIKLGTNMSALNNVLVVHYTDAMEQLNLEMETAGY